MNSDVFNQHLQHMQEVTVNTLQSKAAEYASDDDRLHNFKVAASVQGTTPLVALGGMMAKHTVSVYDMIGSGTLYAPKMWEEKIKDFINYLFLLWALALAMALAMAMAMAMALALAKTTNTTERSLT